MTRVNPDKDVQPTGQFEIYNVSETMSAIYSPEGAFLGSMRKKRIETLAQAYRNELGDLPQAIAKLIARYKDGSIAHHSLQEVLHCSAKPHNCSDQCPGRNNWIVCHAIQFQSKNEAILCPICRRRRVWCSPKCIFFHLAGQLLLPPRTLGCPNADPAMGPCMRQHPD